MQISCVCLTQPGALIFARFTGKFTRLIARFRILHSDLKRPEEAKQPHPVPGLKADQTARRFAGWEWGYFNAKSNACETVNTLRYAARAKEIRTKPVVLMDPREALILSLKREIDVLQNENKHLRSALHIYSSSTPSSGEQSPLKTPPHVDFADLGNLEWNELTELVRLYVKENAELRKKNNEFFTAREQLQRDHELVCRENERLSKKLEELKDLFTGPHSLPGVLLVASLPNNYQAIQVAGGQKRLVAVEADAQHRAGMALKRVNHRFAAGCFHVHKVHASILAAAHGVVGGVDQQHGISGFSANPRAIAEAGYVAVGVQSDPFAFAQAPVHFAEDGEDFPSIIAWMCHETESY
ncbi:hypothetical protein D910_05223 [Dendroctonus ponderosae]|uniref:Kinesin motor domain-containing protein n=1 Tax=Dendroctonus ponderosae TaxID=77166 RepID=U4U1X8_DENPD|nr:hypothetical protein D910_05223 [Dendroctonus ponderosae]